MSNKEEAMSNNEFTASNGIKIVFTTDGDDYRLFDGGGNTLRSFPYLNKEDMNALRELFLHERDKELGRLAAYLIDNAGLVLHDAEIMARSILDNLVTGEW